MNSSVLVRIGAIVMGVILIVIAAKLNAYFQPNRDHYALPEGGTSFDDGDMPSTIGCMGVITLLSGAVMILAGFHIWPFP